MKVLLIDVNYKKSSTGKIVHDLAKCLIADGHKAKVLYGRGERSNDGVGIRIASIFEVYFHALMTRLTGLVGFFSFFATRKIIYLIEKFQPDVVHLHELHGYYVNFGKIVSFLKEKKIPVIWTFHCEFAYTGKCGYAYECEKWKESCNNCPQLNEYPASVYFDFTKKMHQWKKTDFSGFENLIITTPSRWLAERVEQSFLKYYDIRAVYNGIDVDDMFHPVEYAELLERYDLKKKKIILSVAPNIMSDRKGGHWVLKLANLLGNKYQFILVGVTKPIEDLPSNVLAINKTNNQIELAKFYSMADILLLTSEKETFSLVTAESLACGTPVIGFDSGAPPEVAPEGYGYFVPYGRLDLLLKSIKDYFEDRIKLHDRSQCEKFAKENYSNRVMYINYLNLYREIHKEKSDQ